MMDIGKKGSRTLYQVKEDDYYFLVTSAPPPPPPPHPKPCISIATS